MMRLVAILSFTGILMFSALSSTAQCTGARYRDYLFQDSAKADVIYGLNLDYNGVSDTLKLDLHFPKSDPNPHARPLIIWAHAGDFIQGDKMDQDVLPLCQSFARMGYVVASINYREGLDNYPTPGPDTLTVTRALIRAMQDARASVRFFRNSFANGNPYGIDTSMIFFGGTSTGGMVALHLAYLNSMSDFPLWCDTTKTGMGGGLQGLSGTKYYTATTTPVPSNVSAVISICGAITDTSWIHAGGIPVICFHGDSDKTIPYGSGTLYLESSFKVKQVQGSYNVIRRASNQGLTTCFYEYVQQDNLPEVSPLGSGPAFLDTTLNLTRNFLATFTCGDTLHCNYRNRFVLGVKEQVHALSLQAYPNPALASVTLEWASPEEGKAELVLYSSMGQELRHYQTVTARPFTLERGNLASGLYFIAVRCQGTQSVIRIVFN
ncbi:MAG: alpha/beta hydrolase fold domain-containing protein [Bacteroidia bacterium]